MKTITVLFANDSALAVLSDARRAGEVLEGLQEHERKVNPPENPVRRVIYYRAEEVPLDPSEVKPLV